MNPLAVAALVVTGLLPVAASTAPPTPTATEPAGATVPTGAEEIAVGTSVEGRPITAVRRGDPAGRKVVVIGVIHGDEDAGTAIVDRLDALPVPAGVDLYLIESMNPDGMAAGIRHNANGVDLNRNFPHEWGPIAEPGNWEYAGPSAASEPETQAIVGFVGALQPDVVVWYHQDLFMVAPAQGRDGEIRERYAELTGLPLESPTGGTYTGVAAQWARNQLAENPGRPGVAFIVELGPELTPADADLHATAVTTILAEGL